MDDISDLIKRLRKAGSSFWWEGSPTDYRQAADALERLSSDLSQLRQRYPQIGREAEKAESKVI
jgi:hypothetical protein